MEYRLARNYHTFERLSTGLELILGGLYGNSEQGLLVHVSHHERVVDVGIVSDSLASVDPDVADRQRVVCKEKNNHEMGYVGVKIS